MSSSVKISEIQNYYEEYSKIQISYKERQVTEILSKNDDKIMKQDKARQKVLTAQKKLKFSIKDFFSKFDQIYSFLRIWSILLKKS